MFPLICFVDMKTRCFGRMDAKGIPSLIFKGRPLLLLLQVIFVLNK